MGCGGWSAGLVVLLCPGGLGVGAVGGVVGVGVEDCPVAAIIACTWAIVTGVVLLGGVVGWR